MRVLMISEFFPPVMGGLERHVAELSRALAEKGHTVKVLTLGWKGLAPCEEKNGLEVCRSSGFFQNLGFLYGNKDRRFHPPVPDYILAKRIFGFIKDFEPDIIHCHGWIVYSVYALKKYLHVPLVVTLHDYGLICPARTLLRGASICDQPFASDCPSCARASLGAYKSRLAYWGIKANKNKAKMVDKFIAVSSFVKEAHLKYLDLDEGKISVIPNFYSQAENETLLEAGFQLPDEFILFVGTFSSAKGVDVLVEAYKKLKTDVKLVLIGLKHNNFNVQQDERIIILENQPHHVVMEAWRRCRFGVVPSVWPEPFGMVATEAMACGKAVVASDIGGLKDIVVRGETGLLAPPGDAEALAEAMQYLLGQPAQAEKMGKKGERRVAQCFNIKRTLQELENVYFEIANNDQAGEAQEGN